MSDKLQEIKQWVQGAVEGGFSPVTCPTSKLVYLIEQLEQAQAEKEVIVKELGEMTLLLESETYWANLLEQINTLQAANQKLVECLEWYGDVEHYQTNVVDQWQPVNLVMSDLGERARNTLSESLS